MDNKTGGKLGSAPNNLLDAAVQAKKSGASPTGGILGLIPKAQPRERTMEELADHHHPLKK